MKSREENLRGELYYIKSDMEKCRKEMKIGLILVPIIVIGQIVFIPFDLYDQWFVLLRWGRIGLNAFCVIVGGILFVASGLSPLFKYINLNNRMSRIYREIDNA